MASVTPTAKHLLIQTQRPGSELRIPSLLENCSSPIRSLQDLEYEADINGQPILGKTRLVDDLQYRYNHVLWSELLDFRSKLDGIDGVKDIWRGMRSRGVDIPIDVGDTPEVIWETFWSIALREDLFLEEVWNYAKDLCKRKHPFWKRLHLKIVGHMLRHKPAKAFEWHKTLQKSHIMGKEQILELIGPAISSSEAILAFKRIYLWSEDKKIYDEMVSTLCEHRKYDEALSWHHFLIARGDTPSHSAVVDPLKRLVASIKDPRKATAFQDSLAKLGLSFAGHLMARQKPEPVFSPQERVFKIMGVTVGSITNTMTDSLAARVFATGSFSVDFAFSILTRFGLEMLGPLALRELAGRCSCSQEILSRIEQLQQKGVGLDGSLYVRLVHKLVRDDNWPVLQAVLSTDQHPDVFEDLDTQKKILAQHVKKRDWLQAHMTLVILTAFRSRPSTIAWNYVLVSCMESYDFAMLDHVLNDMLFLGVDVLPSTIRRSFFLILGKRKPGKRPTFSRFTFDDLAFVANTWMKILRAGGTVPALAWNQILTYFGMLGRLGELERLSVWLTLFYSNTTSPSLRRKIGAAPRQSTFRQDQDLAVAVSEHHVIGTNFPVTQVMNLHKKKAMIAWGFKTLGEQVPKKSATRGFADAATYMANLKDPKAPSKPDWKRGILLLRGLRSLGVSVARRDVRGTLRTRLQVLFGQGESRRLKNRVAMANNRNHLGRMARHINRMYRSRLFRFPQHVWNSEVSLGEALFKAQRREPMPLRLRYLLKNKSYKGRLKDAASMIQK